MGRPWAIDEGDDVDFWSWYVRRGRIGRRTFWLHYVLPFTLLSALALAVDVSFGNTSLEVMTTETAADLSVDNSPFVTLVGLLTLVPSVSAQVTRLHDRGMPAWWLLLNLVPFFGQLTLLVITGVLPGQPHPNRYGPPPAAAWGGSPTYPPSGHPQQPQDQPFPSTQVPDHLPPDWR